MEQNTLWVKFVVFESETPQTSVFTLFLLLYRILSISYIRSRLFKFCLYISALEPFTNKFQSTCNVKNSLLNNYKKQYVDYALRINSSINNLMLLSCLSELFVAFFSFFLHFYYFSSTYTSSNNSIQLINLRREYLFYLFF